MTERIDYEANRQKLIDALESNEYTQRKGMMRDQDGCMCIHGLMCEVYRQNSDTSMNWIPRTRLSNYRGAITDYRFGDSDGDTYVTGAPSVVTDWFGLTREGTIGGESGVFLSWAMARNDTKGWTFQQFADELKRINNLPD